MTCAPDARVLLAVCRLEPQKGLDVAVRALPDIRARHPEAELVVLGEGPQRSELERLAGELHVPVHLLGRVPDVAAWLRRAELLVHPARWEGFGLALLEGMLASKPVVATNVSSIPEIVADGETGLLVAPDDPAALATAVIRVLDDPAATASKAVSARSRSSVSGHDRANRRALRNSTPLGRAAGAVTVTRKAGVRPLPSSVTSLRAKLTCS